MNSCFCTKIKGMSCKSPRVLAPGPMALPSLLKGSSLDIGRYRPCSMPHPLHRHEIGLHHQHCRRPGASPQYHLRLAKATEKQPSY